jgi:hypothetical protein
MMSFMQGSPLPDITVTKTTEQQAPDYYTDYLKDLAGAAEVPLGKTGAELVAGFDPLQDLGYGQYETAAGSYIPGMTSARQLAGRSAGMTPERISSFMDPYQRSVVDEMARLSAQNVQRNVMPQFKAGFVGSGGLGGQRYAGALGQSLADIQLGLQGQQAQTLSKGYQDALRAAFDEMSAERESSKLQADLAKLEQALGLEGAGALTKAGAERQAYEQAIIDAPLKTALSAQQLLKGYQIPLETIETEKGPKPGAYGQSDFERIAGILSLVGAYGGQGTKDTSNLQFAGMGLKDVLDQIGKLNLPSFSAPNTTYNFGGNDLI